MERENTRGTLDAVNQKRLEGFVALHSFALAGLLCAVYFASIALFEATAVVTLHEDLNFRLYLIGVLFAGLSIARHLRGSAARYGMFTAREAVQLTVAQIMRLMLSLFAIAFATKDAAVSRNFIAFVIAGSAVLLALANLFLPRVLIALFERRSLHRTIIVAHGATSLRLRAWMKSAPQIGEKLHGYVSDLPIQEERKLPWFGRPDQLAEIVRDHDIDQILVDQTYAGDPAGRIVIEECEHQGCRVRYFVDTSVLLPATSNGVEFVGGYAFAQSTPEPLDNPANRSIKRLLDIAVALPVVVFVLPLLVLVTAVFQRAQAPGPVLYSQWRTGFNRRRFRIFKLRTMYLTNPDTARQATRGDARIYPFGSFLRRTSLDELPQFLNVFLGDMSVSGPRPHLLEHDELFARRVRAYRKRHLVKPGITGLAQMNGYRGEICQPSDIFHRVRYDMHYVAKWSLWLDIRIIFGTIRQIFFPPSSAV